MKKHKYPPCPHVKRAVLTISASALMLGVSPAATVGFNFQVDWTDQGIPSYTGKQVTATAFGIPANTWENLYPLPTGYCSGAPGPFTTNEVVNTTTSSGGLHPLPNGSLSIKWSCTAAGSSGFAGYGVPYIGPSPHGGNQEVYYGFLRDEANIYSHPVGGPVPYSVTITGLSSVWTNNPYAIELIASTDTGSTITNAYIGSVAADQVVTYDAHRGGYGVLGGLSTLSGPWTNDSITIWGAPAASYTNGTAIASTICGFIITDKPVISMPPNSVSLVGGDSLALSSYAVGVPPLSYQWRQNGQPIPGATSMGYTNLAPGLGDAGTYDVVVTNLYGADTSAVATVSVDRISITPGSNFVIDSNPNVTEHDGRNWGATWLATSTDASGITRTGVMSFSATITNQIVVPGHTTFDSESGTITFWMNASQPITTGPYTLFDRSGSYGLLIVQYGDGTVWTHPGSAPDYAISTPSPVYGWHHIAVSFNQTNALLTIYVDGVMASGFDGMPVWSWQLGQPIELGSSHNTSYEPYNGQLDDVRFYNTNLSDSQIASIYHTGALVNPSALALRLNFDGPPTSGVVVQWQATGVVLQSADSVQGPFTDQPGVSSPYDAATQNPKKFYRYRGHIPQTVVSNPFRM